MIVVDTSGLLAALDPRQQDHESAARGLAAARPPLLLSPFVLCELDYLLRRRSTQRAELAFLAEVERGVYRLEPFAAADVAAARAVIERYADIGLSLADASLVVLARRAETRDILTLDERHFRVVRAHRGRPFRLWPADAP